MWNKILPVGLVLVMVLSFAACVGEPSALEIVNGTFESLDDITSYQFDMDMTMEAAGEAEDEAFEMNMMMDFSGALDLENRQMRADITMNMAVTGEDEMGIEMELYLIDDMLYMMTEVPEMGPMWMKQEISEGDWEEMSEGVKLTESQLELLKSAEVKVLASEKIKGIDCYVLQLTPDMEQLWRTVMQQAQVTGEEILPEVEETFLEEVFRNFSVKQWFAKDTYFLTKAEIAMTMELSPEALGYPEEEGETTMDITMTIFAYDYNKPVSIALPPEAEEAVEVPTFERSTEDELEATDTELANVQIAVIAMMVDNGLWELPNPVTTATNDMGAFPDTSLCGIDKVRDKNGNVYVSGKDKDGYVLYQHDITGDGTRLGLVDYVVERYTMGTYIVDSSGTVTQTSAGPILEFAELASDDEAAKWENELGRWKPAKSIVNGQEMVLTSAYFKEDTYVTVDEGGGILLIFEWNETGSKLSEEITGRLIGEPMGIFLGEEALRGFDGKPIAPIIRSPIITRGQIIGLTLQEARELSEMLNMEQR